MKIINFLPMLYKESLKIYIKNTAIKLFFKQAFDESISQKLNKKILERKTLK